MNSFASSDQNDFDRLAATGSQINRNINNVHNDLSETNGLIRSGFASAGGVLSSIKSGISNVGQGIANVYNRNKENYGIDKTEISRTIATMAGGPIGLAVRDVIANSGISLTNTLKKTVGGISNLFHGHKDNSIGILDNNLNQLNTLNNRQLRAENEQTEAIKDGNKILGELRNIARSGGGNGAVVPHTSIGTNITPKSTSRLDSHTGAPINSSLGGSPSEVIDLLKQIADNQANLKNIFTDPEGKEEPGIFKTIAKEMISMPFGFKYWFSGRYAKDIKRDTNPFVTMVNALVKIYEWERIGIDLSRRQLNELIKLGGGQTQKYVGHEGSAVTAVKRLGGAIKTGAIKTLGNNAFGRGVGGLLSLPLSLLRFGTEDFEDQQYIKAYQSIGGFGKSKEKGLKGFWQNITGGDRDLDKMLYSERNLRRYKDSVLGADIDNADVGRHENRFKRTINREDDSKINNILHDRQLRSWVDALNNIRKDDSIDDDNIKDFIKNLKNLIKEKISEHGLDGVYGSRVDVNSSITGIKNKKGLSTIEKDLNVEDLFSDIITTRTKRTSNEEYRNKLNEIINDRSKSRAEKLTAIQDLINAQKETLSFAKGTSSIISGTINVKPVDSDTHNTIKQKTTIDNGSTKAEVGEAGEEIVSIFPISNSSAAKEGRMLLADMLAKSLSDYLNIPESKSNKIEQDDSLKLGSLTPVVLVNPSPKIKQKIIQDNKGFIGAKDLTTISNKNNLGTTSDNLTSPVVVDLLSKLVENTSKAKDSSEAHDGSKDAEELALEDQQIQTKTLMQLFDFIKKDGIKLDAKDLKLDKEDGGLLSTFKSVLGGLGNLTGGIISGIGGILLSPAFSLLLTGAIIAALAKFGPDFIKELWGQFWDSPSNFANKMIGWKNTIKQMLGDKSYLNPKEKEAIQRALEEKAKNAAEKRAKEIIENESKKTEAERAAERKANNEKLEKAQRAANDAAERAKAAEKRAELLEKRAQELQEQYKALKDEYPNKIKNLETEYKAKIDALNNEIKDAKKQLNKLKKGHSVELKNLEQRTQERLSKLEEQLKAEEQRVKDIKIEYEEKLKINEQKHNQIVDELKQHQKGASEEFEKKLKEEIERVQKESKAERDKILDERDAALERAKEEYAAEKARLEREIKEVKDNFDTEKEKLKEQFEAQKEKAISEQRAKLEQLEKEHKAKLEQLEREHKAELEKLRKESSTHEQKAKVEEARKNAQDAKQKAKDARGKADKRESQAEKASENATDVRREIEKDNFQELYSEERAELEDLRKEHEIYANDRKISVREQVEANIDYRRQNARYEKIKNDPKISADAKAAAKEAVRRAKIRVAAADIKVQRISKQALKVGKKITEIQQNMVSKLLEQNPEITLGIERLNKLFAENKYFRESALKAKNIIIKLTNNKAFRVILRAGKFVLSGVTAVLGTIEAGSIIYDIATGNWSSLSEKIADITYWMPPGVFTGIAGFGLNYLNSVYYHRNDPGVLDVKVGDRKYTVGGNTYFAQRSANAITRNLFNAKRLRDTGLIIRGAKDAATKFKGFAKIPGASFFSAASGVASGFEAAERFDAGQAVRGSIAAFAALCDGVAAICTASVVGVPVAVIATICAAVCNFINNCIDQFEIKEVAASVKLIRQSALDFAFLADKETEEKFKAFDQKILNNEYGDPKDPKFNRNKMTNDYADIYREWKIKNGNIFKQAFIMARKDSNFNKKLKTEINNLKKSYLYTSRYFKVSADISYGNTIASKYLEYIEGLNDEEMNAIVHIMESNHRQYEHNLDSQDTKWRERAVDQSYGEDLKYIESTGLLTDRGKKLFKLHRTGYHYSQMFDKGEKQVRYMTKGKGGYQAVNPGWFAYADVDDQVTSDYVSTDKYKAATEYVNLADYDERLSKSDFTTQGRNLTVFYKYQQKQNRNIEYIIEKSIKDHKKFDLALLLDPIFKDNNFTSETKDKYKELYGDLIFPVVGCMRGKVYSQIIAFVKKEHGNWISGTYKKLNEYGFQDQWKNNLFRKVIPIAKDYPQRLKNAETIDDLFSVLDPFACYGVESLYIKTKTRSGGGTAAGGVYTTSTYYTKEVVNDINGSFETTRLELAKQLIHEYSNHLSNILGNETYEHNYEGKTGENDTETSRDYYRETQQLYLGGPYGDLDAVTENYQNAGETQLNYCEKLAKENPHFRKVYNIYKNLVKSSGEKLIDNLDRLLLVIDNIGYDSTELDKEVQSQYLSENYANEIAKLIFESYDDTVEEEINKYVEEIRDKIEAEEIARNKTEDLENKEMDQIEQQSGQTLSKAYGDTDNKQSPFEDEDYIEGFLNDGTPIKIHKSDNVLLTQRMSGFTKSGVPFEIAEKGPELISNGAIIPVGDNYEAKIAQDRMQRVDSELLNNYAHFSTGANKDDKDKKDKKSAPAGTRASTITIAANTQKAADETHDLNRTVKEGFKTVKEGFKKAGKYYDDIKEKLEESGLFDTIKNGFDKATDFFKEMADSLLEDEKFKTDQVQKVSGDINTMKKTPDSNESKEFLKSAGVSSWDEFDKLTLDDKYSAIKKSKKFSETIRKSLDNKFERYTVSKDLTDKQADIQAAYDVVRDNKEAVAAAIKEHEIDNSETNKSFDKLTDEEKIFLKFKKTNRYKELQKEGNAPKSYNDMDIQDIAYTLGLSHLVMQKSNTLKKYRDENKKLYDENNPSYYGTIREKIIDSRAKEMGSDLQYNLSDKRREGFVENIQEKLYEANAQLLGIKPEEIPVVDINEYSDKDKDKLPHGSKPFDVEEELEKHPEKFGYKPGEKPVVNANNKPIQPISESVKAPKTQIVPDREGDTSKTFKSLGLPDIDTVYLTKPDWTKIDEKEASEEFNNYLDYATSIGTIQGLYAQNVWDQAGYGMNVTQDQYDAHDVHATLKYVNSILPDNFSEKQRWQILQSCALSWSGMFGNRGVNAPQFQEAQNTFYKAEKYLLGKNSKLKPMHWKNVEDQEKKEQDILPKNPKPTVEIKNQKKKEPTVPTVADSVPTTEKKEESNPVSSSPQEALEYVQEKTFGTQKLSKNQVSEMFDVTLKLLESGVNPLDIENHSEINTVVRKHIKNARNIQRCKQWLGSCARTFVKERRSRLLKEIKQESVPVPVKQQETPKPISSVISDYSNGGFDAADAEAALKGGDFKTEYLKSHPDRSIYVDNAFRSNQDSAISSWSILEREGATLEEIEKKISEWHGAPGKNLVKIRRMARKIDEDKKEIAKRIKENPNGPVDLTGIIDTKNLDMTGFITKKSKSNKPTVPTVADSVPTTEKKEESNPVSSSPQQATKKTQKYSVANRSQVNKFKHALSKKYPWMQWKDWDTINLQKYGVDKILEKPWLGLSDYLGDDNSELIAKVRWDKMKENYEIEHNSSQESDKPVVPTVSESIPTPEKKEEPLKSITEPVSQPVVPTVAESIPTSEKKEESTQTDKKIPYSERKQLCTNEVRRELEKIAKNNPELNTVVGSNFNSIFRKYGIFARDRQRIFEGQREAVTSRYKNQQMKAITGKSSNEGTFVGDQLVSVKPLTPETAKPTVPTVAESIPTPEKKSEQVTNKAPKKEKTSKEIAKELREKLIKENPNSANILIETMGKEFKNFAENEQYKYSGALHYGSNYDFDNAKYKRKNKDGKEVETWASLYDFANRFRNNKDDEGLSDEELKAKFLKEYASGKTDKEKEEDFQEFKKQLEKYKDIQLLQFLARTPAEKLKDEDKKKLEELSKKYRIDTKDLNYSIGLAGIETKDKKTELFRDVYMGAKGGYDLRDSIQKAFKTHQGKPLAQLQEGFNKYAQERFDKEFKLDDIKALENELSQFGLNTTDSKYQKDIRRHGMKLDLEKMLSDKDSELHYTIGQLKGVKNLNGNSEMIRQLQEKRDRLQKESDARRQHYTTALSNLFGLRDKYNENKNAYPTRMDYKQNNGYLELSDNKRYKAYFEEYLKQHPEFASLIQKAQDDHSANIFNFQAFKAHNSEANVLRTENNIPQEIKELSSKKWTVTDWNKNGEFDPENLLQYANEHSINDGFAGVRNEYEFKAHTAKKIFDLARNGLSLDDLPKIKSQLLTEFTQWNSLIDQNEQTTISPQTQNDLNQLMLHYWTVGSKKQNIQKIEGEEKVYELAKSLGSSGIPFAKDFAKDKIKQSIEKNIKDKNLFNIVFFRAQKIHSEALKEFESKKGTESSNDPRQKFNDILESRLKESKDGVYTFNEFAYDNEIQKYISDLLKDEKYMASIKDHIGEPKNQAENSRLQSIMRDVFFRKFANFHNLDYSNGVGVSADAAIGRKGAKYLSVDDHDFYEKYEEGRTKKFGISDDMYQMFKSLGVEDSTIRKVIKRDGLERLQKDPYRIFYNFTGEDEKWNQQAKETYNYYTKLTKENPNWLKEKKEKEAKQREEYVRSKAESQQRIDEILNGIPEFQKLIQSLNQEGTNKIVPLATGGIIKQPIIGEKGQEAVIPFNNSPESKQTMMELGGIISDNIIHQYQNPDIMQDIIDFVKLSKGITLKLVSDNYTLDTQAGKIGNEQIIDGIREGAMNIANSSSNMMYKIAKGGNSSNIINNITYNDPDFTYRLAEGSPAQIRA